MIFIFYVKCDLKVTKRNVSLIKNLVSKHSPYLIGSKFNSILLKVSFNNNQNYDLKAVLFLWRSIQDGVRQNVVQNVNKI